MSLAVQSTKTLWMLGDGGGPEVFITVPEVAQVNTPDMRFDLLDISSHDNDTGFRTFLPGLKDGENVSAEVIAWKPWLFPHYQLRVDRNAGTRRNYKLRLPVPDAGGTVYNTVTYQAYVTAIAMPLNVGEQVKASITTKVTGAHVWSSEAIGTAVLTIASPWTAAVWATLKVYLFGRDTTWTHGVSVVSFSGTGITINSTEVHSPSVIEVNITIDGGAAQTARNVTVTTGAEVVTKMNGLTITA